jgi:peptidoglycan hydrolase CwlO-like protein
MKLLLTLLLPALLCAESITEKKAQLSQKSSSQDSQVAVVNEKIVDLRKKLERCYSRIHVLEQENASEGEFKSLLAEVNQIRKEIAHLEESWHEAAITESKSDEEGYALWNEEETTLWFPRLSLYRSA